MNFSKLDKLIDSMPDRGIPACDLGVTQNGKEVYRRSAGYSDYEKTKRVSHDDLYWIFSATKVVTCTAAMRLLEEGKFDLDDPVSKYIKEFGDMVILQKDGTTVKCETPIKMWNLFSMTSGMNYDISTDAIKEVASKPESTTLDIVKAMAKTPLLFEPGTRYRYSLSHDVIAAIIEIVSGMKYSEYLKKVIIDPLGMEDMGVKPTEEQKKRFSAMYRYDLADGTTTPIPNVNHFFLNDNYESGGAAIFSSVDDYLKLVTALACDGVGQNGYRLLKPETIAMMEKNYLCKDARRDLANGRLYGYGWGLCGRVHIAPVYSLSKSSVGEFGWDGAAGAFCMVDRKKKIGLYYGTHVQSCSYGYNYLHPLIRNLVCEALED